MLHRKPELDSNAGGWFFIECCFSITLFGQNVFLLRCFIMQLNAKVIVILCHPVKRVLSDIRMKVEMQGLKEK